MAYNVYIACDTCGATFSWVNYNVSLKNAESFARKRGWRVGKTGWFCPEHKTKKGRDLYNEMRSY